MICVKCNKEIPDGSKKCPLCEAELVSDVRRCPNCWARLNKNDEQCPKCGCDIEKRLKEIEEENNVVTPTFKDKIKNLPKWVKVTVPSVLIAIVLIVTSVCVYLNFARSKEAARLADDYVVSVDFALVNITKLAQAYEDNVYKKSWLDRTGSAAAVREVYSSEIELIKRTREPIRYTKTRIEKKGNEAISKAVNKMYESYAKCYNYVIGENGKYPGYMNAYNNLLSDYDDSVKELKKITQKYK